MKMLLKLFIHSQKGYERNLWILAGDEMRAAPEKKLLIHGAKFWKMYENFTFIWHESVGGMMSPRTELCVEKIDANFYYASSECESDKILIEFVAR